MITATNKYDGSNVLFNYESLGFQKFDTVEVFNKEIIIKGFFISFKECTLSTPKTFKRLIIFYNEKFYIIEPESIYTETRNESGHSTMFNTRMVLSEKKFKQLDFLENTF